MTNRKLVCRTLITCHGSRQTVGSAAVQEITLKRHDICTDSAIACAEICSSTAVEFSVILPFVAKRKRLYIGNESADIFGTVLVPWAGHC